MTVYRATLSKEALLDLDSADRRLFISIAHVANEVKGMQKLLLWSSNFQDDNDALVQGRISLSLLLLRKLAGTLNEAHRVIQQRFTSTKMGRDYQPLLSSKGKEALRWLKHYFGSTNLVNGIRNRHAFHYSPEGIDSGLADLPDKLEMYLEDTGSANNLFYFAEALATRSLLKEASGGGQNEAVAFNSIVSDINEVARRVDDFAEAFMSAFIELHAETVWEGNAQKVSFESLTRFSSVTIDWFTDTSTLKEDYAPVLARRSNQ